MNLSKAQPSVFLVGIDGVALGPFVVFAEDTIDNPETSQTAIAVMQFTTPSPQDHRAFSRAERRSDLVRRALDVMPIQAFHEGLLDELGGLRAFAVFLTGSHEHGYAPLAHTDDARSLLLEFPFRGDHGCGS
jgi:hypothetical protein